DCIVISPGISLDIPIVKAAQARGIDVVSEVELAYEVSKSPIVAVTGTRTSICLSPYSIYIT
ncbi:UDP-N-acetylmuramoylalanine-D-glutamate ligase, partial [human gut metagenome]